MSQLNSENPHISTLLRPSFYILPVFEQKEGKVRHKMNEVLREYEKRMKREIRGTKSLPKFLKLGIKLREYLKPDATVEIYQNRLIFEPYLKL